MLGIGLVAILLFFELSSGRVQEILPVLENRQSEPDMLQPGPGRQQQEQQQQQGFRRRYRPLELQEIEEAEVLSATM